MDTVFLINGKIINFSSTIKKNSHKGVISIEVEEQSCELFTVKNKSVQLIIKK